MLKLQIRFFNTFEPVNSFYRDLLPKLAVANISVDVMVSQAEYRQGRASLDKTLCHPNIKIHYISDEPFSIKKNKGKLWSHLTYGLGVAIKTLFGPAAELNFFLTQPPLFQFWGTILKLIRRQPYFILVMDLYPDIAVQAGLLSHQGYLTRILTFISRITLKQADKIIVIGRCMRDRLLQAGIASEQIEFIPNWANTTEIYPVPQRENKLRQELGLKDKFVVLYSGNMGVSHYFDDLLEVIQRLQHLHELQFVFIGHGARRCEIEEAKQTHKLNNILILPFQPVDKLPYSLSLGDLHFVSLRTGYEGLVVPSKTYGILAAGCPVIYQGSPLGEIARLITEEHVGAIVPPNNPDTLEKTILNYYENRYLVDQQGEKAYQLTQSKLSCDKALSKYLTALTKRIPQKNYAS